MLKQHQILQKFFILLALLLVFSNSQNEYGLEEIQVVDNSWGLYKPHLLFCVTQRSLNPLNFGLIYTNQQINGMYQNIKNNLRWKFGNKNDLMFVDYISNNGIDFAEQKIVDSKMNLEMQMVFIKNEEQQWGINLQIKNKDDSQNGMIVYLYLTSSTYESNKNIRQRILIDTFEENKPIKLEIEHSKKSILSDFIEIIEINKQDQPSLFELKLLQADLQETWDMQKILLNNIDFNGNLENSQKMQTHSSNDGEQSYCDGASNQSIRECSKKRNQSSKRIKQSHNIAILKITNPSRNNLNFFIRFQNSTITQRIQSNYTEQNDTISNQKVKQRQQINTGQQDSNYFENIQMFEQLIKIKKDKFKLDLKQIFGYEKEDLIQSTISNLLGGIVFYHGKIVVRNSLMKNDEYKTVFSASPSRKIFPRAFLWDEGFHDSIICVWNEMLCKQFIYTWLQIQDVFGYIPREQVRTTEISIMVPDGFRSQDSYEANPPTLLLPILQITQGRKNISFLQKSFRKLEKWFKWFSKTQSGLDFHNKDKINRIMLNEQLPPHYRWQCKGYCKDGNFMGSGLDDYPRQDPLVISKQHLDLQSWMIFFTESLETLSARLNYKPKQASYKKFKEQLKQQLMNEFLDRKSYLFKDLGAKVFNNTDEQFVTHLGYITIYPLIFNAIQNNSYELQQTLDLLYSKDHLWTEYGIRSLSLKDPLQGTGDDYWRGAIWMPLNYLILRSLKLHYFQNEKAKIIYHELRDNLIQNVYKNWKQSGYLYETYNPYTGQGQRGYPFNGWTSLIVLIIKQDFE